MLKFFSKALAVAGISFLVSIFVVTSTLAVEPVIKVTKPFTTKVIPVTGTIEDAMANRIVQDIKLANKDGYDLIEMDITSYGGSVYAGLRILGAMSTSKVPIKTVCEGYCMSMGAVILAHGNTRYATPYTTILLHQVSGGMMGTFSELANQLKEIERLTTLLTEIVSKDTGLDKEKVFEICSYDHYMSTEEALKLNIIDGVLGKDGTP